MSWSSTRCGSRGWNKSGCRKSKGSFVYLFTWTQRNTAICLIFYYLCGSCSPNMNWMLFNQSYANKEELQQFSAETLLPSCLRHRGQRWDKWGVSRHLISLSAQCFWKEEQKKKNNTPSFWRRRGNTTLGNLPCCDDFLRGARLPKCCFWLGNGRHRPG